MPDHMPIGYDIDLLCDAVEVVTRLQQASARVMQRKVRVGFAKAGRLLLLLEGYEVIGPHDSKGQYPVRVDRKDCATAVALLRKIASEEAAGG